MLVCWEQLAADDIPRAGGHIAIDVLREAVQRSGASLYVQACSPECEYDFIHATLRVTAEPTASEYTWSRIPDQRNRFNVRAPGPWSFEDVAMDLFDNLYTDANYFAQMKNVGRRILDLDHKMRHDLDDLSRVQYRWRAAQALPLRDRVRAIWQLRQWKKQSRVFLSLLWWSLAEIENLRFSWLESRFYFERHAGVEAMIFDTDRLNDVARIENLDFAIVRASAEHAASRLDSSALVAATAPAQSVVP
jgi:hypothetical protein